MIKYYLLRKMNMLLTIIIMSTMTTMTTITMVPICLAPSELTESDWENAVRGLGKVPMTKKAQDDQGALNKHWSHIDCCAHDNHDAQIDNSAFNDSSVHNDQCP